MLLISDLAKLHSRPFPRGSHCGVNGAFVDNVPLLRKEHDPSLGITWVPRHPSALNLDLGSGYCLEVNTRRLAEDLCTVADALNKGDLRAARATLAALQLPPFPRRIEGRLNGPSQRRLARRLRGASLLKRDRHEGLTKYNPNWAEEARDRHGRWTSGGQGLIVPVIEPYSPECLEAIADAKRRCTDEYTARGGELGFVWIRRCIRGYVPDECGY